MRVLIATKLDEVARRILEEAGIEVVVKAGLDEPGLCEAVKGCQGLIVRSEKVTRTVLDAADQMQAVVRAGSGVNTIDVAYATTRNIQVMNTPGANSNSVAELVFAFMLAGSRCLARADRSVKEGRWEKSGLMGRELVGKTIGIVGLGNIGTLVSRKAKGFEMNVIGFDPVVSEEKARDIGVSIKSLEEVFAESDFITLHVPLNDKTRGMIGGQLLGSMKKGAMLINSARAEVVDQAALLEVFGAREDLLFGADVFVEGDKEGDKSVAVLADRLVSTPHLGANTSEANRRAAVSAAEELRDFLVKRMVCFPVNNLAIPPDLNPRFLELTRLIGEIAHYNIGGYQPQEVRITCYGRLNKHIDVLTKYLLKGLMDIYHQEVVSPAEAIKRAEESGILVVKRVPDDSKGYGESITIDILSKKQEYLETSIRGTITPESELKINRIDSFVNLDLIPSGHMLFTYQKDRIGLINDISLALSSAGLNILNIRFTTDREGRSIAVLQTDTSLNREVFEGIKAKISPYKSFMMAV
ncbi:NAD(P)-binding domain-containing protein [bacterium]|nr:NAD(P)-binding domain-containing protein [bacterium]